MMLLLLFEIYSQKLEEFRAREFNYFLHFQELLLALY